MGFLKTKFWAFGKNREGVFSGLEFSLLQLINESVLQIAIKKNMNGFAFTSFLREFDGVNPCQLELPHWESSRSLQGKGMFGFSGN